jgi:hypothetical protein
MISVLKKVITWGIVIFIVYYLISDPNGASGVVHSALNGLRNAGNSLAQFVTNL